MAMQKSFLYGPSMQPISIHPSILQASPPLQRLIRANTPLFKETYIALSHIAPYLSTASFDVPNKAPPAQLEYLNDAYYASVIFCLETLEIEVLNGLNLVKDVDRYPVDLFETVQCTYTKVQTPAHEF